MTNKRSLADLAAAFNTKNTGGGGDANWKKFFAFWKAPVDSVSTVRFLPDLDPNNPLGFLVENFVHDLTINGKRETIACAKMYNKPCPICELSSRFYDKNSTEHNETLGKLYYRKRSYIGQVLVLESPVEHDAEQLVKLVEFGPQVFKQIQAAFKSGDLDNAPFELKGGHNFRFRKTVTGAGQNSYTTSNFAPKSSDVEDDVIEAMELYNLSDYRAAEVDRASMEAMLLAAQTGAAYNGADSEDAPAPTPAPAPAPAPAVPKQPQPKSNPVDAEEAQKQEETVKPAAAAPAPSEGQMSVVEKLRARAAAAKAAQQA